METPSRVATSAAVLGLAGLALFAGAPLGIQIGVVGPSGFYAFMLGALLGLAGLLLGLVALWMTRPASGQPGRERAVLGTVLGAVIAGTVFALAGSAGDLPRINDITTDPDDPPRFVATARQLGEELAYEPARFAEPTRQAYPELMPLELPMAPEPAFARALAAVEALELTLVDSDPATGRIEARDTTRIFRFVDDVVIRVRPSAEGSRIDLRSRSRMGQGDLGANAARIRALLAELSRGSPAP